MNHDKAHEMCITYAASLCATLNSMRNDDIHMFTLGTEDHTNSLTFKHRIHEHSFIIIITQTVTEHGLLRHPWSFDIFKNAKW